MNIIDIQEGVESPREHQTTFKILSVEDDSDYQEALLNSLSNLNYGNKEIELLSAYSATEATTMIAMNPDICIIFLDVVMETDEAGLQLVSTIREGLGNDLVRIVLLTGQPGMAPVNDIMSDYDIDDYWNKSDLTHEHLQTIVLSNLRTYKHLSEMREARQGLQMLVEASHRLGGKRDILDYTRTILEEITLLFGIQKGGIVCCSNASQANVEKALIVAASGEFSSYAHQYVPSVIQDAYLLDSVSKAYTLKEHVLIEGYSVLFFSDKEVDGREYITIVKHSRRLAGNEINLLQVFCENVNAGFRNVALHSKLTELAYFDPTSGIHNRNWLVREIRNLPSWERAHAKLLMLYVEDFSNIETVLGAKFCDQLIQHLYGHLRSSFVKTVDIAVLERNILAVLVYDKQPYNEASLENIIHSHVEIDGAIHTVDITVGLVDFASFPNYNVEQLISAGKSTLEHAKQGGRSYLAFSHDLANDMYARYELLKDLRDAVVKKEISIYLQPKVNLTDLSLIGFEALARWVHQSGQFIPPDQFISLAESSGLIGKLDHSIMRQSCRAIKALHRVGIDVPISVNVAGSEITRPGYFESLTHLLSEEDILLSMLELEITESQLIEEKSVINPYLSYLKEKSIRVNIDDFGTGYSSLAYLSTLSASTLKIDSSFVWRMNESEKDWQILKMIIDLGKTLEMEVIAEGIETQEQLEKLRMLGCDSGQGYYFARPMPVEEAIEWARTQTLL